MPRKTALALVFTLAAVSSPAAGDERPAFVEWTHMPSLPDPLGFAGAFVGVTDGVLLVAGGANFPGGRPWDGHEKVWHDRVFLLEDPDGEWTEIRRELARPTAYGVSVTHGGRVICVGGGDAREHFRDVVSLTLREGVLVNESLPELPVPLAFGCGAVVGEMLFVAGGLDAPDATRARSDFLALDLSNAAAGEREWIELPTWSGQERMLAVSGSSGGSFYLMSGARRVEGPDGSTTREFLRDAYRYDPASRQWTRLPDLPRAAVAAPSPAVSLGAFHLLVLGGDDGTHFFDDPPLRDAHPGFSDEILAYDVVTERWSVAGTLLKDLGPDPVRDPGSGVWPPVTTPVVVWGDRIVVPTGEARPGVRTPHVVAGRRPESAVAFGALNWAVLIAYLVLLVGLGVYFSRRGSGDFFLGGGRIPWWAAGLSIYGTQLSAITYLSIPAKAYTTNWIWFNLNMGIVAIAPVVIYLYLPFFRRLRVTSAYEYLEKRFHVSIRLLGSALFVAYQLGRMGIVVLLPALALSAVTGIDVYVCIATMGVLSTLYTVLGGIEAVIWTDVLQVVILIGGAIAALAIVIVHLPGGFEQVVSDGAAAGKYFMFELEWDWTGDAFCVIVLGAIFTNLVPYTSDQAIIQRYMTTADEGKARRAIWTNAVLVIPTTLLFFLLGTALWVYYRSRPELLGALEKNDQILPWFIATEMPAGLAGLVIAGVFAASMSSLDSSMHAIATAVSTDVVKRFELATSERAVLRFARGLTVALGLVGTVTAMVMATFAVQSLWDTFLGVVGLLLGTLGGLFSLGIFVPRAGTASAVAGALSSAIALFCVRAFTELNSLLYAAVGVGVCVAVGGLASFVAPGKRVEGLALFEGRER